MYISRNLLHQHFEQIKFAYILNGKYNKLMELTLKLSNRDNKFSKVVQKIISLMTLSC